MGCLHSKSEASKHETYKPAAVTQNEAAPLLPSLQTPAYCSNTTLPSNSASHQQLYTNTSNYTQNSNEQEFKFMQNVRTRLIETLRGREEDLVRIFYYLATEDAAGIARRPYSSHWDNLNTFMIESNTAFKGYVESILREIKMPSAAEDFNRAIQADSQALLVYSDNSVLASNSQRFDLNLLTNSDLAKTSGLMGLANAWSLIPSHSKTVIMNFIRGFLPRNAGVAVQLCVDSVETFGSGLVNVALATVHLSYKVYQEISRWWKGEISGLRCSQNIVNDTFAVAAGGVGAAAGGLYGSLAGPVGAVAGAIMGGTISAYCAQMIVDRLTQTLFGLPKLEALENAYNYLGVSMTASNEQINTAFHKLCRTHHPDKGGDKDEFLILQCHMAVIREARTGT